MVTCSNNNNVTNNKRTSWPIANYLRFRIRQSGFPAVISISKIQHRAFSNVLSRCFCRQGCFVYVSKRTSTVIITACY